MCSATANQIPRKTGGLAREACLLVFNRFAGLHSGCNRTFTEVCGFCINVSPLAVRRSAVASATGLELTSIIMHASNLVRRSTNVTEGVDPCTSFFVAGIYIAFCSGRA